MKASLFKFFKSSHGKFFGFLVIALIGLGVINRAKGSSSSKGKSKVESIAPAATVFKDPLPTDGYRDKRPFVPAFDNVEEQRSIIAQQREELKKLEARKKDAKPIQPKEIVPISFLAVKPPAQVAPPVVTSPSLPETRPMIGAKDSFAPYGRMIRAKLVTTVDSSTLQSPVIGLVTHDLFWNQKLLIPANSELHAIARPDRTRNRIDVDGDWVIILADGGAYPKSSEIVVKGMALDMEVSAEKDQFALTDGSAGLRGKILTNEDTLNSVKLFSAAFLSGVAEGFTERQDNAFGQSQIVPGVQSAAAQGARAVTDRYAERILHLIERDGAYVRVPAGKQFYLYLREPLLMGKAKLGASLSHEIPPHDGDAPDVSAGETVVESATPVSPEVLAIQQQTEAIQQQNMLRNLELESRRLEIEKQQEAAPKTALKRKK